MIDEDNSKYSDDRENDSRNSDELIYSNSNISRDLLGHQGGNNHQSLNFEYVLNFEIFKDMLEMVLCETCKRIPLEIDNISQCSKCESYFCSTCIENSTLMKSLHKCLENKSLSYKGVTKTVKNLLQKLKIRCIYYPKCEEILFYENYTAHLLNCEYQIKKCENSECTEEVTLKEYDDHAASCKFNKQNCEFCGKLICIIDYNDHLDQCDQTEVTCNGCGDAMLRQDLQKHSESCEKILITCSNCSEIFQRCEAQDHHCVDVFKGKLEIKEKELEENKMKNEEDCKIRQNEISRLEKITSDLMAISKEKDDMISNKNQQIYDFQLKVKSLQIEIDSLREENRKLKQDTIGENEKEHLMQHIKELQFQINFTQTENQSLKIFLENCKLTIKNLRKQIGSEDDNQDDKGECLGNNNNNNSLQSSNHVQISSKSSMDADAFSDWSNSKLPKCEFCTRNLIGAFEDISKCRLCSSPRVCQKCKVKCNRCLDYFCPDHTLACNICNKLICKLDVFICEGCGRRICKGCFDTNFSCSLCQWKFDENFKDKLLTVEDNGMTCRAYSTTSCVSSGILGNHPMSSGVHQWEVRVKSPICKKTDFGVLIIKSKIQNELGGSNYPSKVIHNLPKISIKELIPELSSKSSTTFLLTLDLKSQVNKNLHVKYGEKEYSQAIISDSKELSIIPYFILCNNTITIVNIFIMSDLF